MQCMHLPRAVGQEPWKRVPYGFAPSIHESQLTTLSSWAMMPEEYIRTLFSSTNPAYENSFGSEAFRKGPYRFWNVIGEVNRIWSEPNGLCDQIHEILQHNADELQPPKSLTNAKAPSWLLRCYMVGVDESRAAPHAAIVSDCDHILNVARKVILKHGVLGRFGWGRQAFVRLNTRIVRPMGNSHSNDLSNQAGIETPSYPTGIITDQVWIACSADRIGPQPNGLQLVIGWPHIKRRLATMGGVLKVNDDLWAIPVAHAFQQEAPCDVHDNDDMINFYENDLDIFASTEIPTTVEMESIPVSMSSEGTQPGHEDPRELEGTEVLEHPSIPQITPGQFRESDALITIPGIAKLLTHDDPGEIMVNPYLDYAMIKINHTSWKSNVFSYTESDGSVVVKELSAVADRMLPNGEPVSFLRGSSGVIVGTSTESSSILCLPGVKAKLHVWIVSLGAVSKGDCGSWAVSVHTGELLGMLIATCPTLNEAYILPACRIIADIKSTFPECSVSLPRDSVAKFEAALSLGAVEEIDVQVSGGISLDESHIESTSPLYHAASSGDLQAVEWLIREGADPNRGFVRTTKGVIFKAVETGKPEIVRRLLEVHHDDEKPMRLRILSPLFAAIKGGYVDIIDLLIKSGADMDKPLSFKASFPITEAAKEGSDAIVSLLIEAGFRSDRRDMHLLKSAEDVEKRFPNETIHAMLETARATAEALKTGNETGASKQESHDIK